MPAAKTAAPAPATPAQASLYQQLRGHLAVLKLHDAAGALPAVLDAAAAEDLTMTAALERLLAIEVTADQARRLCIRTGPRELGADRAASGHCWLQTRGRDGTRLGLVPPIGPGLRQDYLPRMLPSCLF